MAGKGGGAWKVAYADFVTAMMAFFLVMWITAQNKAVKESVAQYFENPLGTNAEARATSVHGIPGASASVELEGEQAGPHGSRVRESGSIVAGDPTKTAPTSRPQLHIFERLDRTRSVGTMIVFPVDSVELNDEAKLQLAELAIELRGKPNKVEVRGHTIRGPLPPGSPHADAWAVSYARSLSAMNYLITRGIEPERFRLSQDGPFEPYSDEGNEIKDPRNARVEVFAVSELSHKHKRTIEQRAGDFVPAPDQPLPIQSTEDHAEAGHDEHASGHGSSDHGKSTHGSGHGAAPAKDSHGGGHGAAPAKSGHGDSGHGAGGHGSPAKAKPAAKKASGHGSSGHADSSHGGGHGSSPKKSAAHGTPAKSGGH